MAPARSARPRRTAACRFRISRATSANAARRARRADETSRALEQQQALIGDVGVEGSRDARWAASRDGARRVIPRPLLPPSLLPAVAAERRRRRWNFPGPVPLIARVDLPSGAPRGAEIRPRARLARRERRARVGQSRRRRRPRLERSRGLAQAATRVAAVPRRASPPSCGRRRGSPPRRDDGVAVLGAWEGAPRGTLDALREAAACAAAAARRRRRRASATLYRCRGRSSRRANRTSDAAAVRRMFGVSENDGRAEKRNPRMWAQSQAAAPERHARVGGEPPCCRRPSSKRAARDDSQTPHSGALPGVRRLLRVRRRAERLLDVGDVTMAQIRVIADESKGVLDLDAASSMPTQTRRRERAHRDGGRAPSCP